MQWEEKVLREKLLNRGKHISNDRRKSGFVGKRRVEGFKWGGQTYFVVNQSGRRFNLSYTGILLENVFQYREKYRELCPKIQVTQESLGDATPSRERGRGGEEGRGGEAVKFMGSQTIGSSSCCPGYPPPGSAFFPWFLQNFTSLLALFGSELAIAGFWCLEQFWSGNEKNWRNMKWGLLTSWAQFLENVPPLPHKGGSQPSKGAAPVL